MNPILIQIGTIKIYWYSIIIILGIIIGTLLINVEAKKHNISKEKISDMMFYTIIIGVIGARIYYVIFNLNYYINNPLDIIKVWEGGLAIHGGIIAGAITMIYYTKKHNLNTLKTFDICAPGLLIGQAIGRWGNFFNSEAHGPITTLEHLQNQKIPNFIIEGMNINGNYYLPTFFYESLCCILGLLIILIIRKTKIPKIGQITSFYLIWYSIERFIIESYRTDSLMLNNLKQAQIISIIMIIIGIIIFIISLKQPKYNKENEYAKDI
ncbi:MAG: prolipoprotein diacylglyceryl transferase [Bacilli bacterium]|nr:prolipoprotein diacylglyceryl transferase [Bacilli bacterium]